MPGPTIEIPKQYFPPKRPAFVSRAEYHSLDSELTKLGIDYRKDFPSQSHPDEQAINAAVNDHLTQTPIILQIDGVRVQYSSSNPHDAYAPETIDRLRRMLGPSNGRNDTDSSSKTQTTFSSLIEPNRAEAPSLSPREQALRETFRDFYNRTGLMSESYGSEVVQILDEDNKPTGRMLVTVGIPMGDPTRPDSTPSTPSDWVASLTNWADVKRQGIHGSEVVLSLAKQNFDPADKATHVRNPVAAALHQAFNTLHANEHVPFLIIKSRKKADQIQPMGDQRPSWTSSYAYDYL